MKAAIVVCTLCLLSLIVAGNENDDEKDFLDDFTLRRNYCGLDLSETALLVCGKHKMHVPEIEVSHRSCCKTPCSKLEIALLFCPGAVSDISRFIPKEL